MEFSNLAHDAKIRYMKIKYYNIISRLLMKQHLRWKLVNSCYPKQGKREYPSFAWICMMIYSAQSICLVLHVMLHNGVIVLYTAFIGLVEPLTYMS